MLSCGNKPKIYKDHCNAGDTISVFHSTFHGQMSCLKIFHLSKFTLFSIKVVIHQRISRLAHNKSGDYSCHKLEILPLDL